MPQITEAERVARIQQLLAELNKMPPQKHETVQMPWTAGEPLLEVIRIGVDEVLLNPQSHRIRAQLQDDPEWEALSHAPFSEPAQKLVERHVRAARTPEEFSALKESLVAEGQTDPGVMTHKGLLINANTRVVALREVDEPLKRSIRVAVLPPTAKPEELSLLELRLQMQKQLKVEYTMTNELLFIEELSVKRGLSAAQIARELRIKTDSPKKGESEVMLRLKLLDLIRVMQRVPRQPLSLTFFDQRIKLEQLREVHRTYAPLLEIDPTRARQHLVNFLLSIAVGVTAVHQIRHVDADFMDAYMLPALEEDELVGPVANALVSSPDDPSSAERPPGVEKLVGGTDDEPEPPPLDAAHLVGVITARDKRVKVPGSRVVVDKDDLRDSLKAAVTVGIKDKKRVQKDDDQLSAPSAAVKQATQQIMRAAEALRAIQNDPDFDDRRRKTLEAANKKLGRACRSLDAALVQSGVISRK